MRRALLFALLSLLRLFSSTFTSYEAREMEKKEKIGGILKIKFLSVLFWNMSFVPACTFRCHSLVPCCTCIHVGKIAVFVLFGKVARFIYFNVQYFFSPSTLYLRLCPRLVRLDLFFFHRPIKAALFPEVSAFAYICRLI